MSATYRKQTHRYESYSHFFKGTEEIRETHGKQRCVMNDDLISSTLEQLNKNEVTMLETNQYDEDYDYDEEEEEIEEYDSDDEEIEESDDEISKSNNNNKKYITERKKKNNAKQLIKCDFGRCDGVEFYSIASFSNHYNSVHNHVCQFCEQSFPTYRWLECHVLETHDTLFNLYAQKRKMYECLVDECNNSFWDEKSRFDHLLEHHKYEKSFLENVISKCKGEPNSIDNNLNNNNIKNNNNEDTIML